MLKHKNETSEKMVKTIRKVVEKSSTPRRRSSINKLGNIDKVSKVLSRPTSSALPRVGAPCNIRVMVRVRPTNQREHGDNFHSCVKVNDNFMITFDPKEEEELFFYNGVQQKHRDLLKKPKRDVTFTFDRVFNVNSTNLEVFNNSTQCLIDSIMDGSNCSVFAYGATGAGKTYTMIGTNDSPGITYLTLKELFNRKDQLSKEREFEIMATYIEVYNELVRDLLNPGQPLNLREDNKYGVIICGVKGHKIKNPDELFNLLKQGNKRRTQHPTDANAESSRSHAVFQVYLQMTMKSTREVRRAKLSMIDLAGSERGSATGFVGARFKEGANINKSLLALGNCINSLADGHRHVPYRDSKLTRLLKDSLGGNCHTVMIANISPSSLSFDDTYNTLKYANQAKRIKSNIKRNVVNVDMHLDQYIKLVDDLQTENTTLKREKLELNEENQRLKAEIERLNNGGSPVMIISEESPVTPNDDGEEEVRELNVTYKRKSIAAKPVDVVEEVPIPETPVQETASVSINEEKIIDEEILTEFTNLINEKKRLMEREYQFQKSIVAMASRKKLKVDAESRLSIFYVDSPTKEDRRRKLNEQTVRYEKREEKLKTEIEQNRILQNKTDDEIQTLVGNHPELAEERKLTVLEFEILKGRYEAQLEHHEKLGLIDAYKDKCSLIENMADLTNHLFLAVGGKDEAPRNIKKKYDNLIAAFDGRKNLRWLDDEAAIQLDSGLSSLTSVHSATAAEDKTRATKRKIETDSQVSLESTFTCSHEDNNLVVLSPHQSIPCCSSSQLNTLKNLPATTSSIVAKDNNAAKRLAKDPVPVGKRNSPATKYSSPATRRSPRLKITPRSKENRLNAKKTIMRPDTTGRAAMVKNKIQSTRPKWI